jgi:uncharacterized protein
LIASLVVEGVFERLPSLKISIVEAGFAWVPSLAWRLDKHWKRMKSEVPHLKRPPSEQIHEHIWLTTQPIEEPEKPEDLRHIFDLIGWDRILFATDYPHWDFDDPRYAIPFSLTTQERALIFHNNANTLFHLDRP